jgi:hypothetical protein
LDASDEIALGKVDSSRKTINDDGDHVGALVLAIDDYGSPPALPSDYSEPLKFAKSAVGSRSADLPLVGYFLFTRQFLSGH